MIGSYTAATLSSRVLIPVPGKMFARNLNLVILNAVKDLLVTVYETERFFALLRMANV